MIQKMSDQNKIKFTEKQEHVDYTTKVEKIEKAEAEAQPAKKLDNSKVIEINKGGASGILSAGRGNIRDEGGPKKYIKSATSNSIWDTDIIEKLSKTKDNSEKTKEIKQELNKVKNNMRKESLNNLVESLSNTDTRKDSSVYGLSEKSDNSYKSPANNLSIFDTKKFDEMPKKTAGEKMMEEHQKPKQKDYVKSEIKKSKTINKELFNSLFEKDK